MSADAQPDKQQGGFDGPVLLIGGAGMLGRAWSKLLYGRGVQYFSPGRDQLDLTRAQDIDIAIDQRVHQALGPVHRPNPPSTVCSPCLGSGRNSTQAAAVVLLYDEAKRSEACSGRS